MHQALVIMHSELKLITSADINLHSPSAVHEDYSLGSDNIYMHTCTHSHMYTSPSAHTHFLAPPA